eukprot:scaffold318200_cov23-Tisochrysis_lutea.AAC.1
MGAYSADCRGEKVLYANRGRGCCDVHWLSTWHSAKHGKGYPCAGAHSNKSHTVSHTCAWPICLLVQALLQQVCEPLYGLAHQRHRPTSPGTVPGARAQRARAAAAAVAAEWQPHAPLSAGPAPTARA